MKRKNLLATLCLTAAFLLLGNVGWAQTIFSQNGGGVVSDWVFTNNDTTNAIDKTSYWLLDAGDPSDEIITSAYDLSEYTNAIFTFNVATFGGGVSNTAKVEISYDGGITYTQSLTSNKPTSSSYISGGAFALSKPLSNAVVIKISNSGTSGKGLRLQKLVLTIDDVAPIPTFLSANGATKVAVGVKPTITFDEAIRKTDGSAVTDENVSSLLTFASTAKADVAFGATIDADKKVITITPTVSLAGITSYTIGVNNVEDNLGNEVTTALRTTFTTIDPTAHNIAISNIAADTAMYAGDKVTVKWTAANMGAENVKVQLGTNDGSGSYTYADLGTTTTAGTTSLEVTIPAATAYATDYRFRAVESDDAAIYTDGNAFRVIATPTIYKLRTDTTAAGVSNFKSDTVRISGIVTAINSSKSFTIQNGTDKFNGLYIYKAPTAVTVGDSVVVKGFVTEYKGWTEITASTLLTKEADHTVPAAIAATTLAANNEGYESMLVKVSNAIFDGTKLNDGSGSLAKYTTFYNHTFAKGRMYDVTGMLGQNTAYQILPRSAADVKLYSNDSTLSALSFGGVSVLGLGNIFVTDTTSNAGAKKYFTSAELTPLVGITATGNSATIKITKNGAVVTDAASLTFAKNDVIVVSVTSEDGLHKGFYKVTIVEENRALAIVTPDAVENVNVVVDNLKIKWTASNISNFYVALENATDTFVIAANHASTSSPDSIPCIFPNGTHMNGYIRIADASDTSFSQKTANKINVTDNVKPSAATLYPANAATGAPLNFTLSMTFDEAVTKGSGDIVVYKSADNSVAVTVANANITVSGKKLTASITGLAELTSYYVVVPAGIVTDIAALTNNGYVAPSKGLLTWQFTTGEDVDLFFSEYIEGSAQNKAFEIYNPSAVSVDLSNYFVRSSNNGKGFTGSGSSLLNLVGNLAANDVFVVANAQADTINVTPKADTLLFNTYATGLTPQNNIINYNGDDALGLFKVVDSDTTLIDIIGTPDVDPGSGWPVAGIANATADHTIIRKLTVTKGNTDWVASADSTADDSEWIVLDKDEFSLLGFHGVSTKADITSFKIGTVYGTINTTDHTIAIELPADTDTTKLVPVIKFSYGAVVTPASGDTVSFGKPVTYTVTAQDGTTTQAWTASVTLKDPTFVSIYNIQYSADTTASPYVGSLVATKGIVTAVNSSKNFTIQDGSTPYCGLYVYGMGVQVALGDSVSVTGKITEYNGLTEIVEGSVTIINSGNTVPDPIAITTLAANNEGYESMLVKVSSATYTTKLNDGSGDLATYTTFYSASFVSGNVYNVTGIMGCFKTAQICPRSAADVVLVSGGEPELTSIYDIQYTTAADGASTLVGTSVTTKGIVTSVNWSSSYNNGDFTIQDGTGKYNGIYAFRCATQVALGDSVTVTGTITEYNGLTEIGTSGNVAVATIINSGNTVPSPIEVTTSAANDEGYESMLVKVSNVTCDTTAGTVTDGTGALAYYDKFKVNYTFDSNKKYDITGIILAYNNFQIAPRTSADISVANDVVYNPFDSFTAYPNPFSNEIRFNGAEVSRVTITSIIGQVVMDKATANGESINTGDLPTGIYLVRFINENGTSTVRKMIKR